MTARSAWRGIGKAGMTTPTDAHQAQLALYSRALLTVAERRHDDLPGLTEVCQDDVLVTAGGTQRAAHGWFAPGTWRYGDRHVHELFLNADRRVPHAGVAQTEDLLVTLLHEACHAWAQANDIQDTSRQCRWHNKRFAEIARKIGLVAEPDSRIGHTTPCLTAWARVEYADVLAELTAGLDLAREPKRVRRQQGALLVGQSQTGDLGIAPPTSPYVSASCRCQLGKRPVTIRVARGNWRPNVIYCGKCKSPFVES